MANKISNNMNENMNESNSVPNEEVLDTPPKKKSKKTKIIIAIIVVILIALSAAYYFDLGGVFKGGKVIATVNGEKIVKSEVDERFKQIIALAKGQGVNTDDPENINIARTKALEELIDTKLLFQEAKKAGIVLDDKAADKEIQLIIDQVGDEKTFKEQLSKAGITEEQFKNDITKKLIIQKYITQNVDLKSIKVTNKEISDFYEQISAGQEGVPPLKVIRSQISSQLLSNKQQQAIAAFVKTLRETAKIETSL